MAEERRRIAKAFEPMRELVASVHLHGKSR